MLKMDPYDRRIINSLKGGITKEFGQLLSDVGFSHNTLRQHLDNLVDAGLVVRLKRPKEGSGRPRYVYELSRGVGGRAASVLAGSHRELVVISFEGLSRLCRHEKGGFCKEIRGGCAPQNCPRIIK